MMKILPPKITVEDVIENLYISNVENKKIIETNGFKRVVKKSERELNDFFCQRDLSSKNPLYPKKSKPFSVALGNKKRVTVKKDKMHTLYNRLRGGAWGNFKKYFYPLHESKCAYCGVLHAGTLDHIFPKETYYTFSIIPSNLVRSCSYCNGKKNTFVSEIMVYYPYNEKPLYDFLQVKNLKVDNSGLNTEMEKISPAVYEDYINKLSLKDRLADIIAEEITPLIASFSKIYDINSDYELFIEELKHHKSVTLSRKYLEDALDKLDTDDLKAGIVDLVFELLNQ
ncbi:HNH endonuclease [Enterococcus sp. LJL51]|uniref:HNH endonuclease n=1 Tax=Enterococcus sp. LJL51 TaxID=3416656 RepID=UPI003CF4AFCA